MISALGINWLLCRQHWGFVFLPQRKKSNNPPPPSKKSKQKNPLSLHGGLKLFSRMVIFQGWERLCFITRNEQSRRCVGWAWYRVCLCHLSSFFFSFSFTHKALHLLVCSLPLSWCRVYMPLFFFSLFHALPPFTHRALHVIMFSAGLCGLWTRVTCVQTSPVSLSPTYHRPGTFSHLNVICC